MAVSVFLMAALLFVSVSANHRIISEQNLETIYNTILRHQNAANLKTAKYAPYPDHILDMRQLVQALANKNLSNGVGFDMIGQVYHIIDQKLKYNKASDAMLESINFDMINLTVYHRYEDVNQIGRKMPLLFTNLGPPSATLLKRPQPEALNNSHVLCGSAVSHEQAVCVTSLDEMMEFVHQHMGENVKPVSALPGKWQEYTIIAMPKVIARKMTGCHKSDSRPFAVYECHNVPDTVIRVVPLLGWDGMKVQAVSVCHMNTLSWNDHYVAFYLLKAKPGIPVCHFLATDDIIWLAN